MGKSKHKKKRAEEEEDPIPISGDENRLNTAEPSPSKKRKKRHEPSEVKIELRSENPGQVDPIVGYFPTGFKPSPETSAKVYKHATRTTRTQVVVKPNSETPMRFVGTSNTGGSAQSQMCHYSLGVFDKATNTLKIVPIAANKVFRLTPTHPGSDEPESDAEEGTAEDKYAGKRDLTLMYSSKRNIKQTKKLDALRKEQGPEAKLDLDEKLSNVVINKEAIVAVDTNTEARNLPPFNMYATTPEAAYPLDKIILEGEWDFLKDVLGRSKSGEEFSPDFYPKFVCNRIHKLDSIKDDSEKRKLAAILSYITHLVKFKDRHSMDAVESAKKHRIPTILQHRFSSLFSPTEKNRLPDVKRDLLTNYILVLALYVDDFKMDFADIAKDLRMSATVLKPYLQFLGCKFVVEKQRSLATLPLPLKFPEVNIRRRRER